MLDIENQSRFRAQSHPLTDEIADLICKLLYERNLTAGKKIPSESELSQIFCVGRGTIREAVKLLTSRNLLKIKRGKGTYVSENPGVIDDPFGFRYHEDKYKLISDLVDIRILLEPEMAALAAVHATSQEISQMRTLVESIDKLESENKDYSSEDSRLHTMIAASSQNVVMPNLVPVIRYGIELYNHLMNKHETVIALSLHTNIVNAIEDRDSAAARIAMRTHLEYNKKNVSRLRLSLNNCKNL